MPPSMDMTAKTTLSRGSSIPISPYVTTISFTIYIACRLAGSYRTRRWGSRRSAPQAA
jgi:zinc/manganese transport system permease protein